MTRYTPEELEGNWEFKIVRSETGAFRRPEVFQTLLQEESIAGWELVEKLDNQRVRFKRPANARRRDATLPPGVDPYRSTYGNATARTTMIIGIGILMALLAGLGVVAATIKEGAIIKLLATIPVIIIVIGFIFMLVVIIQRRR